MENSVAITLISILGSLVATVNLGYLLATYLTNVHRARRNRLVALAEQSSRRLFALKSRSASARKRKHTRFWQRPGRTSVWWLNFVQQVVIPEEWREHFRMSRENFLNLFDQLRPFLLRQRTNMRIPKSVEKQVFLYYVSDDGRYKESFNLVWHLKSCCLKYRQKSFNGHNYSPCSNLYQIPKDKARDRNCSFKVLRETWISSMHRCNRWHPCIY